MSLIIASIIILIIGIIITVKKPESEDIGIVCIVIGAIITSAIVLTFLGSYYGCKSEILAFEETRLTYERARTNNENIEIAAIQLDIAEQNRWLRTQQYWNETIFDIAIPDEIMQLEVIK
ncbi:hypothetical protein LCGC14_0512100 [marine sediment metagenome]|uniref:Uncharacterized protein n=1 Tax=marine sediment metagenome TaxID=412755 RepID=A0A0F9V9B4_9ZZZZ